MTMTELLTAARVGRNAENELARIIREIAHESAARIGGKLPNHLDCSDVAQDITPRVLRWLLDQYHGSADAQIRKGIQTTVERELASLPQAKEMPLIVDVPAKDESVNGHMDRREELEAVRQAIDALSEEGDRILLRVYYCFDRVTYSQLAELIGRGETEQSVGTRMRGLEEIIRSRITPT